MQLGKKIRDLRFRRGPHGPAARRLERAVEGLHQSGRKRSHLSLAGDPEGPRPCARHVRRLPRPRGRPGAVHRAPRTNGRGSRWEARRRWKCCPHSLAATSRCSWLRFPRGLPAPTGTPPRRGMRRLSRGARPRDRWRSSSRARSGRLVSLTTGGRSRVVENAGPGAARGGVCHHAGRLRAHASHEGAHSGGARGRGNAGLGFSSRHVPSACPRSTEENGARTEYGAGAVRLLWSPSRDALDIESASRIVHVTEPRTELTTPGCRSQLALPRSLHTRCGLLCPCVCARRSMDAWTR